MIAIFDLNHELGLERGGVGLVPVGDFLPHANIIFQNKRVLKWEGAQDAEILWAERGNNDFLEGWIKRDKMIRVCWIIFRPIC